jgi:hypothetical protein
VFSIVVLGLALQSTTTEAQGWMAGATAGVAKKYDYEVGGPVSNTDDTDAAYRAFGGFLFHPNMGVVLSFVDLGKAFYSGPAFGGFTDTLSADGFDVSFLAGFSPGSQDSFTLFGAAGVFFWEQDVNYADSFGPFIVSEDGSSLSIAGGGELSFGATGRWGLHFEWQRFFDVGDRNISGHLYDRDKTSAGFVYRFGKVTESTRIDRCADDEPRTPASGGQRGVASLMSAVQT